MGDGRCGAVGQVGEQPAAGRLASSMLDAKISVPRPLSGVVERPRLFALLDEAVRLPVTTLAAPAGSGKTQLLASWVPGIEYRVAWLTLDHSDGDPWRFWTGVLTALRRVVPETESTLLSTLSPAPDNGYSPAVLPALVVDALAELTSPVLLVLDDIHALEDSSAAEGLSFLMSHLPPPVRLVLCGTHLPQLPRARLRLEGRLATVPSGALAFTEDEAEALFLHAGVEVDAELVTELTRRTEGWSAGLRFAALTGAEGGLALDKGMLTEAEFETSEYLVTEVMRHLPAEVQHFVLHSCVCERISGGLGDHLTGRSDGAAILRWLAGRNVFTVGTDDGSDWYRYHAVFAAMLRRQLDTSGAPSAVELHRRASEWLADAGLVVESFDHAVRGQVWDRARQTLSRSWLSMYLGGELVTLRDMLDRLPPATDGQGQEDSRLRRIAGLALGEPDAGTTEDAGSEGRTLTDHVLTLILSRSRGDLVTARAAALALHRLAEDPSCPHDTATDIRALALHELGVTEYWAGERAEAEKHLREALTAARVGERDYVALGCISQLVGVLTAQDRLDDALQVAADGVELARRRGWEQTAATAELWHALGWINYLRDNLDDADHYLDQSDEAAGEADSAVRATIKLVRALVLSQRGQKRRALAHLEDAAHAIECLREPHIFAAYVEAETARLLLALGQVGAVRRALSAEPEPGESVHLSIARAELLISDSRAEVAWRLMRRAVEEGSGFLDQRIQARVLLAVLEGQEQGMRSGLVVMTEAVELAATERMIQPMLQFGPRVDRMLEVLERRQSRHHDFIVEVRAHIAASVTAAYRTRPADSGLEEPLTAREAEVLARLDGMDTLPEIAAELFVSVNTVKAHLRSLYRKLGVHGRREALSRAEELGLL